MPPPAALASTPKSVPAPLLVAILAPLSVVTLTWPLPRVSASTPTLRAAMAPLASTVTSPVSLASVILAETPVFGRLARMVPMTPEVTEMSPSPVPEPRASMPKVVVTPATLVASMAPVVSTVILPKPVSLAKMPTPDELETVIESLNGVVESPTVTPPPTPSASTPNELAVIVLLFSPATVTAPEPVVSAWMPAPVVFTLPSTVTVTLPV